MLQLDHRITDNAVLVAGAGYRWFVFKSDLDFDFQGPLATLDLRWARESADGGADWELTGGAGVEWRAFAGAAATTGTTSPPPRRARRHLRDRSPRPHARRQLLLGAGYALQRNDSNSYGDTVTRHVFTARLATPLPLDLLPGGARRADPRPLPRHGDAGAWRTTTGKLLSIEDENRSSLRVDLSRALTDRLQLLARYTFYANEIGVSAPVASYRRQTVLLSLAFTLEN